MATEFFTTDSFGDRIIINRIANDANVVIDSDVLIGSANTDAIVLTASFHDVLVRGTVSGYGNAIRFGDSPTADNNNTLRLASDGLVQAELVGVSFQGSGRVINDGSIAGGTRGMTFNMAANNYSAAITNRGVIEGTDEGIWITGTWAVGVGNTVSTIVNTGTIEGSLHAIRCIAGKDEVINRGVLRGSVSLGDGHDRYDGRGGVLENGTIHVGNGNDIVLPGASEEVIFGSGGYDTLDFRGSGGLRVVLGGSDDGTGVAANDIYWSFEKVLGSRWGNSTLVGDGAANELVGYAGSDTLNGRHGNDTLIGGANNDRLSGGAGDDAFHLRSPGEGADTISDWGHTTDNNDRFALPPGGFSVTWVGDVMHSRHFQSRADNVAQDDDDRFIFRTTDTTLWHDGDGKGGEAAVLLADLQAGAVVTAADFLAI